MTDHRILGYGSGDGSAATDVAARANVALSSPVPAASAAPVEVDAVCGMAIDPRHAYASHCHVDRTYYFCSESCERAFLDAPERYAAVATTPNSGGCEHADHVANEPIDSATSIRDRPEG